MLSILKKLVQSSAPKKEIVVTLEELSTIWLKHNHQFQPIRVSSVAEDVVTDASSPGESTTKDVSFAPQAPPFQASGAPKLVSASFFRDVIEPYRHSCTQQGALEGIYKLVELLDNHGGCPSIVLVGKDEAEGELYSLRDVLSKVSLREHSHRTAWIGIMLLKETYRDYGNLVPKMIVTALGHDLGKIPALRESGLYVKSDHPIISAAKVGEIFTNSGVPWLSDVMEVIKNHHRHTKDQFTALLQQADGNAREIEVAETSKDLVVKKWADWFDASAVLEYVRPEINVVQTGNKWKAFSFGGIVYCQPELLYESTKKLAVSQKIIDITLIRVTEKENAIRKIVDSLRSAGAVSGEIGQEYIGRLYELQMTSGFSRKSFLVPLNIEVFGMASEIEKDKDGFFHSIKGVKPAQK